MWMPTVSLNFSDLVPLKFLAFLLACSCLVWFLKFLHCRISYDFHFFSLLILLIYFFFPVGWRKPQLILLDHGLYKELDFNMRTNYAALWKALIFADANAIKKYSAKLGAGEDLYALFAGILTMRPWNRVIDPSMDHLVIQGNESDRSELQVRYCLMEILSSGFWYSIIVSCSFGL